MSFEFTVRHCIIEWVRVKYRKCQKEVIEKNMLFNSYIFVLLFLPVVLIGYFALNHMKQEKLALIFLTMMSLWFCGSMNFLYMVILLCSIVANFLLFLLLKVGTISKGCRKFILILGIILNIGSLLYFKYFNFFLENVNAFFKTDYTLLNLILPLGISFYAFGQISFLVDAYRQEKMDYSFLEYATYVSFFPKLIQGPIAYHGEIINQLQDEKNKKINFEHFCKGIYSFALGLGKKVLIADSLAKLVNAGYGDIGALSTVSVILVMLAYSLQIYFDFSGYCDMANGVGMMLNIELPMNFNSPYKAESITDFWDRWHMTLTRFFTRYVYIPLGGSRSGRIRTYVNILIVFLISGLWHGANWTFILWGVLNGIVMIIERFLKVSTGKMSRTIKVPKPIKVVCTFLLTSAFWSIFRAPSIEAVGQLWTRLVTGLGGGLLNQTIVDSFQGIIEISALYRIGLGGLMGRLPILLPSLFIMALIFACMFMRNTQEKVEKMKLSLGKLFVTVGLLFWSILSLAEITEFIYFNF